MIIFFRPFRPDYDFTVQPALPPPTLGPRRAPLLALAALSFILFASSASAQTPIGASPSLAGPGTLSFHNQDPVIGSATGVSPVTTVSPASSASSAEPQQELDSLNEQKQTLQSQLLYARSKLNAARKSLDVNSMAGYAEQADKSQQEVKDWDTQVRSLEDQLAQLNTEIQGASQQMQPAQQDNIILPGDNLEIFVTEDPSFNGRYVVRRGGYIIIPQVGTRIFVAGKTFQGAEAEVSRVLQSSQLQRATVMVEKIEGQDVESGPVIYLYGEFKNPRPFIIPTGTKATVVSVILSSGGVTDKADLTRVHVMRIAANKPVVEEENVQRILDGAGLAPDLTLDSGDVVTIPAGSANVIYVTGYVLHASSQPLHPGDKLSAYAAILNAGGFAHFADRRKVYILRAMPDGTKEKIHIDIDAIEHGRAADVPLEGDDILVVPEKFWSL